MRAKVSKNVISFFRRARTQYGCIKAIEGMLLAPLDDEKDEITRKIPNRDRYAENIDTGADKYVPAYKDETMNISKPTQKIPFYRAFDPSFKNGRRIR